jgi:hypothetical protein
LNKRTKQLLIKSYYKDWERVLWQIQNIFL